MKHDGERQIQKCLACSRERCINCAGEGSGIRRGPKLKPIIRFGTGEEKRYSCAAEAAEEMHVTTGAIRNAANYGFKTGGYYWRYEK